MKLYRTDDEVSLSGTVEELQIICRKLDTVSETDQLTFSFETDGDSEPYDCLESTMIIKAADGPAMATFEEELGIIVEGSIESLRALASFFDFESDAEKGSHYHWDEACDSRYVAEGTLPIVVSVA